MPGFDGVACGRGCGRWGIWAAMARSLCGPSESPRQPEGEVDEADEDGDFDKWPDDAGKQLAGPAAAVSRATVSKRNAALLSSPKPSGAGPPNRARRPHDRIPRERSSRSASSRRWRWRRGSGQHGDRRTSARALDAIVTASSMREVNEEERLANDSITVRCAASIQPTWRKRTVDEREVREEDFPFCFPLGIRVTCSRVIRSLQAVLENRHGRFRRSRVRIPPSPLCSCKTYGAARPAARVSACTGVPVFLLQRQGPLPPLAQSSRSAEHAQQPRNPSRKPQRAARRLPPVSRSFVTHS